MVKVTKIKKEDKLVTTLKDYLRIKQEMRDLEESAKVLEKEIFSAENVNKLPETIDVDGVSFIKQTREPVIAITNKMIEDAGLELERIMPLATFSKTLIKTVFGESGKASVEETDAYNDERALKSVSIFYKRK